MPNERISKKGWVLSIKKVILSMDVEDWYHLDYFDRHKCNSKISMLDGVDRYLDLLNLHSVPSTFFILSELCQSLSNNFLNAIIECGHEVASHGVSHTRPLKMGTSQFNEDLIQSKSVIEDFVGNKISGYRAPCFSLDRARLELVQEAGYLYDSSRISFENHPLYGTLDVSGYSSNHTKIFSNGNFFEFELSTVKSFGKSIPVSGGGYLRIFPWFIFKSLINKYLKSNQLYILYIHPFELSLQKVPPLPFGTSYATKNRFTIGIKTVFSKLDKLIRLLKFNQYQFTTFESLRKEILNSN